MLGSGFGLSWLIFEASAEKSNTCSTVLFSTCWLCCQTNEPVTEGCIPNAFQLFGWNGTTRCTKHSYPIFNVKGKKLPSNI